MGFSHTCCESFGLLLHEWLCRMERCGDRGADFLLGFQGDVKKRIAAEQ
jgi:hypothetical protein